MEPDREPGSRAAARFEPVRLGAAPRRLGHWAALGAVLLVVVVAKPWAWADPAPDGRGATQLRAASSTDAPAASPDAASRSAAASPSPPRPSPSPPAADVEMAAWCLGPATWRTVSSETWRDRTVRVWRALEPVVASGPLDPAIDPVPLAGVRVESAGFCAPVIGDDQLAGRLRVMAWRVTDRTARRLALRQLVPSAGETRLGRLWAPPESKGADGWPPGRYVFRIEDASGRQLWWAFEIDRLT